MSSNNGKNPETAKVLKCGIVMPISGIDGLTKDHWIDVLEILKDSISISGFEANLVSEADEISIIQKTIVQNLYNNSIVVCDVSCKNPNVMFELGMRLAFDKPTIIIKDDKTDFTFDTSVIEHLTYPRDLRFTSIIHFKEILSKKIIATHKKATSEPGYTTFLKNFGEFKVAQISEKEISSEQFVLEALSEIKREMREIRNTQYTNLNSSAALFQEIKVGVKSAVMRYISKSSITTADLFKPETQKSIHESLMSTRSMRDLLEAGRISRSQLDQLISISLGELIDSPPVS